MTKTIFATFVLACLALAYVPAVNAQDQSGQSNPNWQGQDAEFGSIRAPFAVTMDGTRSTAEASVVLRQMYTDKDTRFYMFGFVIENTPLDATLDHVVRADNGQELPCAKRESDNTGVKCFVDLKFMPPVGTEIKLSGTLGSGRTGQFHSGSIVMAFDYNWNQVQMSNGLSAQLYADTAVNVQKATGGSNRLAGALGNKVPDVGVVGAVAIGAVVAIGLASLRRRK